VRPVTFADLPSPLRRAISERDGTAGRIALIYPRKLGPLDLEELDEIKELVRGSIDEAGARVQALNTLLLISDIDDVIVHDAPRATLLALSLVCALVLIVMRRLRASALVMAALLTGVAMLVGAAAAAGVRMNFLNFVVLPITFGIGVDYAVNIVQRYREGGGSLEKVLRETGSALALCSLTTVIGYASLMVADSQALAGFGLLAALGEVTCLFTALFVLPAWLARREQAQAVAVEPALEVDLGS
jgi:predicted RND superfamily exporter protein